MFCCLLFFVPHRFLFARFKAKTYYYGLVVVLRNLTFCLIPVAVPEEELGIQLAALCMILLVSGIGQATLRPWRTFVGNVIDSSAAGMLIMILLCGLLSTEITVERAAPKTIGSAVLAVALCMILAAVAHTSYHRCGSLLTQGEEKGIQTQTFWSGYFRVGWGSST